jgi:type IV secretion system protein VirD4
MKARDAGTVQAGEMLLFINGHPAIWGIPPLYFQDPAFKARAEGPAPTLSDVLMRGHAGLPEVDGLEVEVKA